MPRMSIGEGAYKRALDECPEISEYSENPEELLAEDCGIECDLCHIFEAALVSKAVRENPRLKAQLAPIVTEPHPIDHDDLCSWVSCCHSMGKCQGCNHSPEYVQEWLEEMALKVLEPRKQYRPPVIAGHVGASFMSPGS